MNKNHHGNWEVGEGFVSDRRWRRRRSGRRNQFRVYQRERFLQEGIRNRPSGSGAEETVRGSVGDETQAQEPAEPESMDVDQEVPAEYSNDVTSRLTEVRDKC